MAKKKRRIKKAPISVEKEVKLISENSATNTLEPIKNVSTQRDNANNVIPETNDSDYNGDDLLKTYPSGQENINTRKNSYDLGSVPIYPDVEKQILNNKGEINHGGSATVNGQTESIKTKLQTYNIGDKLQSGEKYYQITSTDKNGNPTGIEVDKNGNDVNAGLENPIVNIPVEAAPTGENTIDELQNNAGKRAEISALMRDDMSFMDAHKQVFGERPKDMTKKQKRWLAAIDGLTFLLNVIGQTVGVAKGGNPIAMKQTSVLSQIRDNLIKSQTDWDKQALEALNRDINNGINMYKLSLNQEGKDKDMELKRQKYENEHKARLKKIELDKVRYGSEAKYKEAKQKEYERHNKIMESLGYSRNKISQQNANSNANRANTHKENAWKGTSSNGYKYTVKGKNYFLSTKQREQITTQLANEYNPIITNTIKSDKNDSTRIKKIEEFTDLKKGISGSNAVIKGNSEDKLVQFAAKINPDLLDKLIKYYKENSEDNDDIEDDETASNQESATSSEYEKIMNKKY